jgi:small subunit ribosomal protein S17
MPRSLTGVVSSDKVDKTIVITVATRKTHPIYKKQYTVNSRFMAHDEKNEAKLGDKVVIIETRPISARKRFRLAQILERSGVIFEESDATADVPIEEKTVEPEKPAKPEKTEPKVEETGEKAAK